MASNSTNSTDLSAPFEVITDTDQGGLIAIITAFSLSLVLVISLPIRSYVRSTMSTYKLDDYMFLIASVFCVVQASLVFYALHIGFGKTRDLIDGTGIEPMEKATYAGDILYISALAFSKLSTAFLFIRLTPGRGHVLAIWSTIGLSIVWAIVSTFLVAFRCHPSHPWTDTIFVSECTSIFARWQFIGALDIITEVALFAISVYLVWGIQMSRSSKSLVVGAFGCRLPVIAIVGLRLYYLNYEYSSGDPTYYGAAASSCTQLEIGYSLLASIVPCLKTFMAPYEGPDPNSSRYHSYGNGTNYKLSSMASQPSEINKAPSSKTSIERDSPQHTGYGTGRRVLDRLRPEQTIYEARISHNQATEGNRPSGDSANSQRMIIKKGVEWSVDYDTRNTSASGKDEVSPYVVAEDVGSAR